MKTTMKTAFLILIISAVLGNFAVCGKSAASEDAAPAGSKGTASASTALAEEAKAENCGGPWIPDPCHVIGVSGQYHSSGEENGKTFDLYTYEFTASGTEVSEMILTYGMSMQDLGFTAKRVNVKGSVFAQDFTKSGYLAELAFFVTDGENELSEGGEGVWLTVLSVQQGTSFTLGNKAPNLTSVGHLKCPGCNGTGKCQGCGGTGRANYGYGYEDCILCDRTGICNICDGKGH